MEIAKALSAGPAFPVIAQPAQDRFAKERIDLGLRNTLERDRDLGETVDRDRRETGRLGERLRSLLRAAQRTRVDRIEAAWGERGGGGVCLQATARIAGLGVNATSETRGRRESLGACLS